MHGSRNIIFSDDEETDNSQIGSHSCITRFVRKMLSIVSIYAHYVTTLVSQSQVESSVIVQDSHIPFTLKMTSDLFSQAASISLACSWHSFTKIANFILIHVQKNLFQWLHRGKWL